MAGRPDALSRREQDMPQGVNDERLKNREIKLIKDSWISVMYSENVANPLISDDLEIPKGKNLFPDEYFQALWDKGLQSDEKFKLLYRAVSANKRSLPPDLSDIKVSLSECKFNSKGVLTFRDRIWIPCYEPLHTALIQKTHDSCVTGHPGRDSTLLILSRNFFWPGMSKDVRTYCYGLCPMLHNWAVFQAQPCITNLCHVVSYIKLSWSVR